MMVYFGDDNHCGQFLGIGPVTEVAGESFSGQFSFFIRRVKSVKSNFCSFFSLHTYSYG